MDGNKKNSTNPCKTCQLCHGYSCYRRQIPIRPSLAPRLCGLVINLAKLFGGGRVIMRIGCIYILFFHDHDHDDDDDDDDDDDEGFRLW